MSRVYRRFILGWVLTVCGCIVLVLSRLDFCRAYLGLADDPALAFNLDLAVLGSIILGFLTALSVAGELRRRLARLEALDEHKW